MIRHLVAWSFADTLTDEQKQEAGAKIQALLEPLASSIPGVLSLRVVVSPMLSSNRDVLLSSLFDSEEALQNYQTHPEHVRAGEYIRAVTTNRTCIDYVE